MSDDATATDATATDQPGDGGSTKTFTQDQVNALIAREKGQFQTKYSDYDDLKAKAERLAELEAQQQTAEERLTAERDTHKTAADRTAAENLRLRVAMEKKIPAELIDRMQGSTKEELAADADKLLEMVAPTPSLDGGARGSAATGDIDSMIRRASGRT